MNGAFGVILGLSMAGGATCLIALLIGALAKNRLRKSWLYYLWLVVLLRFMVPVSINLPILPDAVRELPAAISSPASGQFASAAPDDAGAPLSAAPGSAVPVNTGASFPAPVESPPAADGSLTPAESESEPAPGLGTNNAAYIISLREMLPYLWLIGASAMLLWTAVGYGVTLSRLRRGRTLLTPGRVPVYESGGITTPILAGLLRPAVYLPPAFPNPELAVRHELTHLRRGDLIVKWLTQLTVCVHWFNPLIWLMKRELNRLSELACDGAVARRLSPDLKKAYGLMLLDSARAVSRHSGDLVTPLGRDKRLMAERLRELVHAGKPTKRAVVTVSALTVLLLASAVAFGTFLSACSPYVGAASPAASVAFTAGVSSSNPAASGSGAAASAAPAGFVNDPEVIGTWTPFGLAHKDFVPVPIKYFNQAIHSMIFAPDGTMNEPMMTWTKGSVTVSGYDESYSYVIRELDGARYLFRSDKSGRLIDYLGEEYEYSVYKYSSDQYEFQLYTDDIDLPFVDDPSIHGTWNLVNWTSTATAFNAASPFYGNTDRAEMTFSEGGALSKTVDGKHVGLKWTKGVVINPYYKTASAYEIREISGTTYLFVEWKDLVDYTHAQKNTGYSVWIRRTDKAPPAISLPSGTPDGFVNDHELVGTWLPYGYARNDKEITGNGFTGYALVAYENGWTNAPDTTWSKGSFTAAGRDDGQDLIQAYTIRELSGGRFLFVKLSVLQQADTHYGYAVYKWHSGPIPCPVYTDDIDLPFMDDPAVHGAWQLVTNIQNSADFKPYPLWYSNGLEQIKLTFSDGGALSSTSSSVPGPAGCTWTKGAVIDPYGKTAGAYEIKELDGTAYLFLENKNTPNYTYMQVVGGYTVWKKIS